MNKKFLVLLVLIMGTACLVLFSNWRSANNLNKIEQNKMGVQIDSLRDELYLANQKIDTLNDLLDGVMAKFSVDTSRHFGRLSEGMEFRIRREVLRANSSPIHISIEPNRIDTVFFKARRESKWDTIICVIKKPESYVFRYNECCGGYDVIKSERKIKASVIFKLTGGKRNEMYLGRLSGSGKILNTMISDTVLSGCNSAMASNIELLELQKIKKCSGSEECLTTCFLSKGDELSVDFEYQPLSKLVSFLYMPLSSEPTVFKYDFNTKKVMIE